MLRNFQVIIMRGLPGSGKSSYIKKLMGGTLEIDPTHIICSADDFHMLNGKYVYVAANTGEAHKQCLQKFLHAVQVHPQPSFVFVDNTNTTKEEIAPYYRLAELFTQSIRIVRCHVAPEDVINKIRNTHAVPDSTIWNMHQNILSERLPAYWKEEIIDVRSIR